MYYIIILYCLLNWMLFLVMFCMFCILLWNIRLCLMFMLNVKLLYFFGLIFVVCSMLGLIIL